MTARKWVGRPQVYKGGGERLSVYLSKEQADYIRAHAKERHITISASLQELIDAARDGRPLSNLKVEGDDGGR